MQFRIQGGTARAQPKLLLAGPLHQDRTANRARQQRSLDSGVAGVSTTVHAAHHLWMHANLVGRKLEHSGHKIAQCEWPLGGDIKIDAIFSNIRNGSVRADGSMRDMGP